MADRRRGVSAVRVPAPTRCGMLDEGAIAVGAQDVCAEAAGAFTGEVARRDAEGRGLPLRDRRAIPSGGVCITRTTRWWRASSPPRAQAGLTPVLCVGETLEEREAQQTEAVVARQLDAVMAMNGVGALRARHRGLRAGLGHRHRPHGVPGAGAGGACLPARPDRGARC